MTVLTVSSRPPDDFLAVATLDLDFIIDGATPRHAAIRPAAARCVKLKRYCGSILYPSTPGSAVDGPGRALIITMACANGGWSVGLRIIADPALPSRRRRESASQVTLSR